MQSHHLNSSQEGDSSQIFAPKGPALHQIVLRASFKDKHSRELHRASGLAGSH